MSKRAGTDPLKDITSTRGHQLDGKKVVIGVSGSVAAIETPALARELMRVGAEVHFVLSEAAEKFVRVEALEWATGNPVIRRLTGKTEHVRLAGSWSGRADLLILAPCTANTISKIALGIDDTPVTTFASMALGSGVPLMICPAAHEPMYANPAVAANLAGLRESGVEVVEPRFEEGKAKMAATQDIVEAAIRSLARKDMAGRRVLVTGGPTVEFIDPIRVITNLSSGRTGVALAKEAWRRGAEVVYVYGGSLAPPAVIPSRKVRTTQDMLDAVLEELDRTDVFISAAAPADFTPASKSRKKIPTRAGALVIELRPTPKIVDAVRKKRSDLYLVAFKAETTTSAGGLAGAARSFLKSSRADMVIANSAGEDRAFGTEQNELLLVTRSAAVGLKRDTKENLAARVLEVIAKELRNRDRRHRGSS